MDYNFWEALVRIIVFLPLVIGLFYLVVRFGLAKRYIRSRGKNLSVVDQVALSPKATLCVVKVEDKYLLLGVTENRITLIKELQSFDEEVAVEGQACFYHIFDRLKKGRGADE